MKYIFAIDEHLRLRRGHLISEMYNYLSELYKNVIVYHRTCEKKPLFAGEVTVITASPYCFSRFSSVAHCVSFWDVLEKAHEDVKEKFYELKADYNKA